MLDRRYISDGVPVINLNDLQLRMKKEIDDKVDLGIYKFENSKCEICGDDNFLLLSEKDRYGLYAPTVICEDCGLIQMSPRMNQSAYNQFYNVEYRKLYVGKNNPTDDFFNQQYVQGESIFRYLENSGLLDTLKQKNIFEIGCGAGGILKYFKDKGFIVRGIDLGEAYVEYGRNYHDLDLTVGSLFDVKLEVSPDLVIYSHVLEHVLHLNKELGRLHNIMTNNSLLYVEVPGLKNLLHSYDMDFLKYMQNAHVYHFSLTTLKNLFHRNSFDLVKGNEKINSVFKKRDYGLFNEIENDFSDVLSYLHKV